MSMRYSVILLLLLLCLCDFSIAIRQRRQSPIRFNGGNRRGGHRRGNGGIRFPGDTGGGGGDKGDLQTRTCTLPGNRRGFCARLVECAFYYQDLNQLDSNACTLKGGTLGVCCPDPRTVSTKFSDVGGGTVFVEPRLNVPMRDISQSELNRACDVGLRSLDELASTEARLAREGVAVERGSPAAGLLAFFQPTQAARDLNKLALANIEASRELQQRFSLTPQQASYGLQRFNVDKTILNTTCPKVPICDPTAKFRTADGSCNNLDVPNQGKSNTAFQRLLEPAYADGISEPRVSVRGGALPSARKVRTTVAPDKNKPFRTITLLVMQWGQFIDHDLTLGPIFKGEEGKGIKCCENGVIIPESRRHPACFPISIPADDEFFAPFGERCMEFVRTMFAPRPKCDFGFAEQLNALTHYIDANMVYGSDQERADSLRTFQDGLLKTQRAPDGTITLPPSDTEEDECSDFSQNIVCFKGGDVRVNEQIDLTVMHLLWVREHNRIARRLGKMNTRWDDERIYQETRRIVAAMVQHITYNEWLPLIIGRDFLFRFRINVLNYGFFNGYDETINAAVTNEFASAAFRFGHSLLQGHIQLFVNARGTIRHQSNLKLFEQFNGPFFLNRSGALDALTRGMFKQTSQRFDNFFTESITNRLFQGGNAFGLDLVSLNTQRAREHGIPGYNDYRELCGLNRARDILPSELPNIDPEIVAQFRKLYRDVDDIDLFIGGVAEYPVPGAILGETFQCIVGDGFARLRLGDRFAYDLAGQPGSFTSAQLDMIRRSSIARIICDNSDNIRTIQPLAFLTPSRVNRVVRCDDIGTIPSLYFEAWRD